MNNLTLKKHFICTTLLLIFITGRSVAQKNFSFYALDKTGQAHNLNPAFKPDANIYIGVPLLSSHSFGVSNSGFNVSHLLRERPQDDSLQLDPENTVAKMAKRNLLTLESRNELLAFGFQVNKNYFSFGVTNVLNSNFIYTKDMFQLLVEGNGESFLGERASFDKIGVNLDSYVEYALGFNREINDKLTVGARVKLLSGIANINTRESRFGLHTDETTFDLTIDGSATLNTSAIKPFYDTLAPDDYNPVANAYDFSNFGLGFDLGATYQISDKINVSASVLDLGFISWKTDNATFIVDDIDYRFEGVNINQYLEDTTGAILEQLGDSITDLFSQEENDDTYRTSLATRFYLGGTYNVTDNFKVGATLYNEIIKSRYRAAAILSGTITLKHWLSATINYAQYARSFGNLGVGLSLRGGPIQFFVSTDNVLGFFAPEKTKNFHASFGIGLMFGKPDKKPESSKASFD